MNFYNLKISKSIIKFGELMQLTVNYVAYHTSNVLHILIMEMYNFGKVRRWMMNIIFILMISLGSSIAQPTHFDSLNMRYVGGWPFGPANDMAVDTVRNITFMASGCGILIYSMDSTPPYLLSRLKFRYKVVSLLYDGIHHRLFAGFGGYGLGVIDVSAPASPNMIACSGDQRDYSTPYDMKIYEHYLLATGTYGGSPLLLFYDLSNMSNLFYYGYRLSNGAAGIDILDHYAFVTEGRGGLEVIDINRISHPSTVSSYSDSGYMTHIEISGNYAFVAEFHSGVAIINISNIHSLQPVGQVYFNGMEEASYVCKRDSLLYITDPWGSLWIADVSNPYSPTLVNRIENVGTPWKVVVHDTLAYMLGRFENGTYLLNVTDPTSVSIIKKTGGFDYSDRLTLRGNTALITYGPSGAFLIDVSNPTDPQFIGHISGDIYYAIEDSPYVFVANQDTGMEIFDISDPSNPQMVGSIDSIKFYKMIPQDTVLYAVKEPNCILKIDISDPSNPTIIAENSLFGRIVDFAITDSDAVVLSDDYLIVVNLKDFRQTYITRVFLNRFGGVAIQNNFVYIVKDAQPGLSEYRLLNDSLYIATSVDSSFSYGARVAVSGQYLYVGDFNSGVRIFDISDYLNIQEVADYQGFKALDIATSGGYALTSTGDMGLQIFGFTGVGVNEDEYRGFLKAQFLISTKNKVKLMLPVRNGGKLEIYDVSGRRVYSKRISRRDVEVNLPGRGIYMWKYKIKEKVLRSGRILVVR